MSIDEKYYARMASHVQACTPDELNEIIHITGIETPMIATKAWKCGQIIHQNRVELNPLIEHVIFSRKWSELSELEQIEIKSTMRRNYNSISLELRQQYKISWDRIRKALKLEKKCFEWY